MGDHGMNPKPIKDCFFSDRAIWKRVLPSSLRISTFIVEKKIDIACNAHYVHHHHHADASAEVEVAISASASG